ncbi:ER membrane protein SH3 [Umbelopsis sp. PMI_123]|nr:ER membrane protein SH3 [Umbelopsis sp. PMI_123]
MSVIESLRSSKVALIVAACFFQYGRYWADWAFDYYLIWSDPAARPNAFANAALYYANQYETPKVHQYISFVDLLIASLGLGAGLASMRDANILFDGASLVLMISGLASHVTSIRPSIAVVASSNNEDEIIDALKNIAAAHTIIVTAVTGIVLLQVAHYFCMKRWAAEDAIESKHSKKHKHKSH